LATHPLPMDARPAQALPKPPGIACGGAMLPAPTPQ
jgi:hypothetical protein